MNRLRHLCILLAVVLVVLIAYPYAARCYSTYVAHIRSSRTASAASSNLTTVIEPWLVAMRPYLEQFPANLPHIIKRSVVYHYEEGRPQEVFASFQYTVLINSNDLALKLSYNISLNEMGLPLGVQDEGAVAVLTRPSGSIAEKDLAEHLSQVGATPDMFNHYYGATVPLTNLPSYLRALRDGDVLPQLEERIQDGARLVGSTRRTHDDILKLMSQQESGHVRK